MHDHSLSAGDVSFLEALEDCTFPPDQFDHRAHVRLAYVCLVGSDPDDAHERIRTALKGFLLHHGEDVSKYHETITRAWILAVRHFMEESEPSDSADEFIDRNPVLLDRKIMMSHYSAEVLFSDEARARFVDPDLDEIPLHE
jgi:hypothetical protein